MSKACDHPAVWRILHPDKTAYACEGHLTTLRGPKLAYSKMLEPGTGIICDWEGEGMSERKASYGATQLIEDADKRQQQEWADFHAQEQEARKVRAGGSVVLGPNEQMETVQPTGLPTLLARMVVEFQEGLGSQSVQTHEALANHFTTVLLSAAQPILTEYLNKLANPPMVVKQQEDEANLPMMVRALLAAERQRAEEALALVRAGKGVSAARKHLGLE